MSRRSGSHQERSRTEICIPDQPHPSYLQRSFCARHLFRLHRAPAAAADRQAGLDPGDGRLLARLHAGALPARSLHRLFGRSLLGALSGDLRAGDHGDPGDADRLHAHLWHGGAAAVLRRREYHGFPRAGAGDDRPCGRRQGRARHELFHGFGRIGALGGTAAGRLRRGRVGHGRLVAADVLRLALERGALLAAARCLRQAGAPQEQDQADAKRFARVFAPLLGVMLLRNMARAASAFSWSSTWWIFAASS